jgi:hypothetical protein
LIVLIANAHLRNPDGIVASAFPLRGWRPRNLEEIVA